MKKWQRSAWSIVPLLIAGSAMAVLLVSGSFHIARVWLGGAGSRATSAGHLSVVSGGQGIAGPVISGGSFRLRGGFIQPLGTVITSSNTCTAVVNAALETVCTVVGPSGSITITIPGGALSGPTALSIVVPGGFPVGTSNVGGFNPRDRGVNISVDPGISLLAAYRVDLSYQNSDVPGAREDRLRLAYYDAVRGRWVVLPARQVDLNTNVITGQQTTFGFIQLVALSPADDLEQVVAGPNPVRPGQGHRQMVFSNLPDGVLLEIFTLTGELVKTLTTDAGGQASWDVTNNDGNNVLSGSYLAVFQRGSENRVLTIAVER